MQPKNPPEMDNDDFNAEDFTNLDIKINPEYYIHNALTKAQKSLSDDDVKQGHWKYIMFINQIEILCRAAKMLPEEYENNVKIKIDAINSDKNDEPDFVKQVKIANVKLEILMSEIFNAKTITDPLRLGIKKTSKAVVESENDIEDSES